MVKTHEISIKGSTAWQQFTNNNYMIINKSDINIQDYILFKNVETIDAETVQETGLYRMTQVIDIVEHEGLKEGYVLVVLNKM